MNKKSLVFSSILLFIICLSFAVVTSYGFLLVGSGISSGSPAQSLTFDGDQSGAQGSQTPTLTGTAANLDGIVECNYNGGSYADATDTGTGYDTWSYTPTLIDDGSSYDVICRDKSDESPSDTLAVSYTSGSGGISFAELTQGTGTSNPQNTASITPTANAQVFVTVAMAVDNTPSDSLAVSGCGLTWTKIGVTVYGGRRHLWVYRGVAASPTTGAITLTYSGTGNFQEFQWSVDEATGVDSTIPNGDYHYNYGSGVEALAVPSLGTPDTGDVVYGAFAIEGGSVSAEPDSGTVLSNIGSGANVRTTVAFYDDSATPDSTPSITWTGSNDAGGIGFIINAD